MRDSASANGKWSSTYDGAADGKGGAYAKPAVDNCAALLATLQSADNISDAPALSKGGGAAPALNPSAMGQPMNKGPNGGLSVVLSAPAPASIGCITAATSSPKWRQDVEASAGSGDNRNRRRRHRTSYKLALQEHAATQTVQGVAQRAFNSADMLAV